MIRWISLCAVALAACNLDEAEPLRRCHGRAFEPPAATGFRHDEHADLAPDDARHRAQDFIAPPEGETALTVTVAYGVADEALDDELVQVFVDTCDGWRDLGVVATDDDGVATLTAAHDLDPGAYEVRFVVLGDATEAIASLWVLPVETRVVVTDIDATMTTSDAEIWRYLVDNDYVPEAYPAAAELTRAHANRGHVVVYLTARPTWLNDHTRAWLADGGFAAGPVFGAGLLQVIPSDATAGAFKRDWLIDLAQRGYTIDLAYGNTTTDIHAYRDAGVATSRQWIIGPEGGTEGTHAVADTWSPRAAEVRAGSVVAQPWH